MDRQVKCTNEAPQPSYMVPIIAETDSATRKEKMKHIKLKS